MSSSRNDRIALLGVLSLTMVAAVTFIAVILSGLDRNLDVHETGGAVLLVLILVCVGLAARGRPRYPGLILRTLVALACLIAAAVLGALLASRQLAAIGAPLVPLAGLIVATADAVRLVWTSPAAAPA